MGKIHIIAHSDRPFRDRIEAGGLLASELKRYSGNDTVILGIPRGGVIIASEVARSLGSELDIVLSRKLGAPGDPELAIGAVSEDGKLFLHDMVMTQGLAESPYIKEEKAHQIAEIARRVAIYRRARPKAILKGKTVIVVDDGLATGATMQAALWMARHEGAKKLISAVPVAPADTVEKISNDADELIVLRVPQFFGAVGQFYEIFDQTSDGEVLKILEDAYKRRRLYNDK
jgi:putative phosphoribosyl transferase